MSHTVLKATVLLTGIACILLTVGCSKLTTDNYEQLKMGMEYNKVIEILGTAEECNSAIGLKKCIWGDSEKNITVNFAGDRVVMFSAKGL